jgi:DNA gyrase subunit A
VIGAARHLIDNPDAGLDDLMRFVPGPDLPLGGKIVGLDGIRDAYESGRGSFRTRATARVENVTPRRKGIVVTELPYLVGPEKVIEKVKVLVQNKKLQGISDITDLTDRTKGLHLVIEIKNGFNPEAVLEQLYKLTPMEESFGINNVALVDGQPRTLGLRQLLQVYVDFRTDVVRRRTAYRLRRRQERLHLVEGLLVAILDIDEVIQLIRGSDDVATARERLMQVFDLTEVQATYILDLQLRRLTKFSRIELETERDELLREIERLTALLEDNALLLRLVSDELAEVAREHGTPRRTVLLESAGVSATAATATPMEVTDDPCWVLMSSTGLLARTSSDEPLGTGGTRRKHDVVTSAVRTTARGYVGLVTSAGRLVRISALELPTLPPTNGAPTLSGGAPLAAFVDLPAGEQPLTLCSLGADAPGLALGTRQGVVKRVSPDYPANKDSFEVIGLKDGDAVVGAVELATGDEELVFVSSDAQLLHFPAAGVRPQGRGGGGIAGVKLGAGATVVGFWAVDPAADNVVVTVAGAAGALPGTEAGSVKVTPFTEYPAKGRATGGVRCHRFLRGEDALKIGWAGAAPPHAASANGVAVELPEPTGRRDGSGTPAAAPIAAIASGG